MSSQQVLARQQRIPVQTYGPFPQRPPSRQSEKTAARDFERDVRCKIATSNDCDQYSLSRVCPQPLSAHFFALSFEVVTHTYCDTITAFRAIARSSRACILRLHRAWQRFSHRRDRPTNRLPSMPVRWQAGALRALTLDDSGSVIRGNHIQIAVLARHDAHVSLANIPGCRSLVLRDSHELNAHGQNSVGGRS